MLKATAHVLLCTLIIVQNVTISMDEGLLSRAREHARSRGTTFNQLVRDLVAKEVSPDPGARTLAMFALADRTGRKSEDGPMSREEANDRA